MKLFTVPLLILLFPCLLKAGIRTTDVRFQSGRHSLKGRLITAAPEGRQVPVIIFCVGSKTSSFEAGYKSFLNYFFEDNLPLDQVALFYFEKRGVGGSEGNWAATDFSGRAADALAAAEYLKSQPFIDPRKIIVAGHSQGGWIAQLCAASYPETFAAGISMAGPPFSVKKQVVNDLASQLRCAGTDSVKALRKAEAKTGKLFSLASVFPVNSSLRQLKVIRKFEPSEQIRQIRVPFLFMFGENDALVNLSWAKNSLREIFPQGLPDNMEMSVTKAANHSFELSDLCSNGNSYAPEAKDALNMWFRKNFAPGDRD